MASIHRLLDTFGPPPREICLDWAYQIQAAAASLQAAEAAVVGSAEGAKAARKPAVDEPDWTALEVADDGSLELERLTEPMARQALAELRGWLAERASSATPPSNAAMETQTREIEPTAETFRASASLDLNGSDREACRRPATPKRGRGRQANGIEDPRRRLTAAALLAAAVTILIGVWIAEEFSASPSVAEQASSTADSHNAQQADPSSVAESSAIADTDLSAADDSGVLEGDWTTSEELTGQALKDFDETPTLVRSPTADLALTPSLAAKPSESAVAPRSSAAAESTAASVSPSPTEAASHAEPMVAAADAERDASIEISDVMSQVASAVAQAETQSNDRPSQDAVDEPDSALQPALMLTRDANPLRIRVARGVAKRSRGLHWTARLELPEEFICEPSAVQSIEFPAGAQWRIYDKDAKPPRACVVVSVRQRSGRDLDLEWMLRGSAEDFPQLRLPIATKWLDGLSAQLKVTAASLRAATDAPAQQLPKEMRTLVQSQRQLARRQLAVAERLLTLLADVNRTASLLDDELLGHAELRASDSDEIVVAYGSCVTPPLPHPPR